MSEDLICSEEGETSFQSTVSNGWQSVMDLSESMRRLAHAGQWDELAVLAWRRQALVTHIFDSWSRSQNPQTVRDEIEVFRELDREILAMAEHEQDLTRQRLRKFEKGKQAQRLYRMG